MPQYRQEFGGIIIYDIDSIMPGQPLPDQSIDIDKFANEKNSPSRNKNIHQINTVTNCNVSQSMDTKTGRNTEIMKMRNTRSIEKFINSSFIKISNQDPNQNEENECKDVDEPSFGCNEIPPDYHWLKTQPMVKDIIKREDRFILEDCIINFPKKRTYRNEGRKVYKLTLPPYEDIKVRFESRFENGNLWKVAKISNTEYNLALCYDFNTNGHTQWYYFKIDSQLKAGTRIKFNIVNLMKPNSLSSNGMKPCVKSVKHFKSTGVGWHRDCTNISYKMNQFLRNKNRKPTEEDEQGNQLWSFYYFTLSFTYELLYDNDTVFFAHAIPYTYNNHLIPFLNSIANNQKFKSNEESSLNNSCEDEDQVDYSSFLRIGTLCKSLASNHLKMVTITDNISTYRNSNEEMKWMLTHQSIRSHIRSQVQKDVKYFFDQNSPDKWEYENRIK